MADQRIDRGDPFNNCYFSLEINGAEIGHFMECTGFKTETQVYEFQEGGYNPATRKLPGQSKWNTITLKYMTSGSTELLEWRDKYITDEGFTDRATTTGAVVLRAEDGTELRRYSFSGAWPVSWEGPQFKGGSSDVAAESLEIAFDYMQIGQLSPTPPEPAPPTPPDEFETGPVQFEYDSAKLTPEGKQQVDNVSKQLDKHPEVKTMYVEGHTCDLGTHGYNQSLSQARAESVAKELKKSHPEVNYVPNGYSYDYPVAPNNSEANRSRNRRVQFFTSPRSGKRSGELDYKSYKK